MFSLDEFLQPADWGTKEEKERRNRIKVSVAAYSYEYLSISIMSDGEFDKLCQDIDPIVDTGRPILDKFFREQFSPHTGQWIRSHPELDGIASLYEKHYTKV